MSVPEDLKYSRDHEWVLIEGNIATVGITDHAQAQLGDVVFIELPEEEDDVTKGESFGTVESTKAVADLYAPASGVVVEVNNDLLDNPETVNQDPYGDAWMIKIEISDEVDLENLMDAETYERFIEEAE